MCPTNPEEEPKTSEPSTEKKKKTTYAETGHAINVANLEDLISFCVCYASVYNPCNPRITISSLKTLYTNTHATIKTVSELLPIWMNAIDQREIIFAPLSKLITKVYNSLSASGTSKQYIADSLTIVRKLQGRRAKPIPKKGKQTNTGKSKTKKTDVKIHKYISASQTSMDSRIENFYKLISLLKLQPLYVPNETELTTNSLTTLLNKMITANTEVIEAFTPLNSARIVRNSALYRPETGLVSIANETKKYFKSVFGASNAIYKKISKIKFKKRTNLAREST